MAHARLAAEGRPLLLAPALLGLAALAWAALVAWEASPLAHALHVAPLAGPDLACERPAAFAQGALYVGGWVLMTMAMMLPTVVPLSNVFARLVGRRDDRVQLFARLVAGYLLAWLAFGVVAHLAHAALRDVAQGSGWFWTHDWVLPAIALATAGAFQFSRLKAHCLDACRSPTPFVVSRWRGLAPSREALRLGFAHGVYCVGCCWALMLLMFGVGISSVAWMLALGALMAIEKNAPGGRHLGGPLGAVLLGAAAWTVVAAMLPSA
jgi:predicted metal-binding membrane protein